MFYANQNHNLSRKSGEKSTPFFPKNITAKMILPYLNLLKLVFTSSLVF